VDDSTRVAVRQFIRDVCKRLTGGPGQPTVLPQVEHQVWRRGEGQRFFGLVSELRPDAAWLLTEEFVSSLPSGPAALAALRADSTSGPQMDALVGTPWSLGRVSPT
jgi:hypothetical protein